VLGAALVGAAFVSGLLLAAAESLPKLARFEFTQSQMGTTARIVVFADDGARASRAAVAAFERIAELARHLTDYRDDSELMRACNDAVQRSVPVSRDVYRVLQSAQQLAARTDGAFDVTAGPLTRLWRHARRQGELPDAREWAAARDLVGYRMMHLSPEQHTLRLERRGMRIDVGGIAKGYAADAALGVLRASGYAHGMVVLGGDIAAGDAPPRQRGWRVTIAPLGRAVPPTREVVVSNTGVSTSGDAEQWVEIGGVRYSHILDPRTGTPLAGRGSVTIIARDATTSDMLATAASVLGGRAGLQLVDDTPGAAGLIGAGDEHGVRWSSSKRWPTAATSGQRGGEQQAVGGRR
jgi:FAD:protein FMN transferase